MGKKYFVQVLLPGMLVARLLCGGLTPTIHAQTAQTTQDSPPPTKGDSKPTPTPTPKQKLLHLKPGTPQPPKPELVTPPGKDKDTGGPESAVDNERPLTEPRPAANGSRHRDPTEPQGELRRLLSQQDGSTTRPAGPIWPSVTLKARIIGTKQQAVALLGVGSQRLLVVESGREYAVPDQPDLMLSVMEISARGVVVKWLPDGKELLLP